MQEGEKQPNPFVMPGSVDAWDREQFKPELTFNEGKGQDAGAFVVVKAISELPPSLLERMPELAENEEGFVIKKYDTHNSEFFNRLFRPEDYRYFLGKNKASEPKSEEDITPGILIEAAHILEKRQKLIIDCAGDDKDLILTSEFLVDVDAEGKPALYEIQKRLPIYQTTNYPQAMTLARAVKGTWKERFQRKKTWKGKEELRENLDHLISLIRKIRSGQIDHPYLKDHVPDCHPNNVAMFPDSGKVVIFDTNYFYDMKVPDDIINSALNIDKLFLAVEKLR